jgi:molybdate transport system substrate-binding protein
MGLTGFHAGSAAKTAAVVNANAAAHEICRRRAQNGLHMFSHPPRDDFNALPWLALTPRSASAARRCALSFTATIHHTNVMTTTPAASITLRTSNSTRPVLDMLLPDFERATGHTVTLILDTAKNSLARIKAGERADAAVLLGKSIDELAAMGVLSKESCQPFARSTIGMAVLKGAPKPDISTVEAFKRTLLNAKSIAHTVHGPSGAYFPGLIERLGIADQVKPKTVTRPGGYIGVVVTAGEAEMAFQQICELLAVPGLDVVGPIPEEIQYHFDSKAAIFSQSKNQAAARELLAYFARAEHAPKFIAAGLSPL